MNKTKRLYLVWKNRLAIALKEHTLITSRLRVWMLKMLMMSTLLPLGLKAQHESVLKTVVREKIKTKDFITKLLLVNRHKSSISYTSYDTCGRVLSTNTKYPHKKKQKKEVFVYDSLKRVIAIFSEEYHKKYRLLQRDTTRLYYDSCNLLLRNIKKERNKLTNTEYHYDAMGSRVSELSTSSGSGKKDSLPAFQIQYFYYPDSRLRAFTTTYGPIRDSTFFFYQENIEIAYHYKFEPALRLDFMTLTEYNRHLFSKLPEKTVFIFLSNNELSLMESLVLYNGDKRPFYYKMDIAGESYIHRFTYKWIK